MNVVTNPAADPAAQPIASPADIKRLSRKQKVAIFAAPLALLAGVALVRGSGSPVEAAPPPATVTAAAPLIRQISEWDDYSGRFEASRSVEVRPRVSGAIVGVHFQDGALVRKGQLLFTIDPRPFTAALAEARAAVQGARSDLALARADLGRATRLLDVDAVSRSDVDRLRARVQQAEATLAAADARVRSRALDVGFTQVRAPITGRVSDRRIDAGNLVSGGAAGGEATLLTTINALDPIYFTFDASEALFLKARRARESGAAPSAVLIRLQDETDYRWHGRLDFTDNALDTRSGTIRLRAVVDNGRQFLTPGMFGNLRLAAGGTTSALLVPDAAVQMDQARKVVTVVAPDGSLSPRPVVTGPLLDGLRVVRSGLATTDRVVISGAQLAMPGMKVRVRPGVIRPVAAPAAPAQPSPLTGEATFAGR
ncbi:efflux RND transporter periplasmic adaptor subunit [Sphingomonas sp. BN140010]|uniref:Efflux RND transporter periplasmic adaptor subunit n=1 Tax=Sphingomonas arvum TaxID=2992113 RepID=A0ABT3JCT9_9SPHN|nr:efflux RND transporter periplasmic adaptor subunit [Sphingomonas sp. BN140010]MCW3796729.1 efflux RND transporter periplasmic adaptor subunit [Sphingomonas sp. BN140010]